MSHLTIADAQLLGRGMFYQGHFLPFNQPPRLTVMNESNDDLYHVEFPSAPAYLEAEAFEISGRPGWIREMLSLRSARHMSIGATGAAPRKRKNDNAGTTNESEEASAHKGSPEHQHKRPRLSSQKEEPTASSIIVSKVHTHPVPSASASPPAAENPSSSNALLSPSLPEPELSSASAMVLQSNKLIFNGQMDEYEERVNLYMNVKRWEHAADVAYYEGRVLEDGYIFPFTEEMLLLYQKFRESVELLVAQKDRASELRQVQKPSNQEGGGVGIAGDRDGEGSDDEDEEEEEIMGDDEWERIWAERCARIEHWLETSVNAWI